MRQRKKRRSYALAKAAGVLLLAAGAVLLWRGLGTAAEVQPATADTQHVSDTRHVSDTQPVQDTQPVPVIILPASFGLLTNTIPVEEADDTGLLVLVNGTYAVTDEPYREELACAYRVVPVRVADMHLRAEALAALDALFDAAAGVGLDNLVFSSGFRDEGEQREIYVTSADKSFVQPPGYSEHQTGLAADIFALGVLEAAMPDSREGKWLAGNAARFGFILRYPAGKEDVTGISYEPWHFRYVGAPHADYCEANGIVYEEYIRALQETGGYEWALDGVRWTVLYVRAEDGMIKVPGSGEWTASSDNTGGYILTIRE